MSTSVISAPAGQSKSNHVQRHPARTVFTTKALLTCVNRFLMPTFSSFVSGVPATFPHSMSVVNTTCRDTFKETLKTHAHVIGFLDFVKTDSEKWFINSPKFNPHKKIQFTYKMMIKLANYIRTHGNSPWTTPTEVLD